MNLNHLIVPLYSMPGPDLGVKSSKLRNNIRHGRMVDPVGDIPAAYVPDFAALHAKEETMGTDAFIHEWAAFEERRKAIYDVLVPLWKAKDYSGMVKAMEAAEQAEG